MPAEVTPPESLSDNFRGGARFPRVAQLEKNKTDGKVQGIVLAKIQSQIPANLLGYAGLPQAVIGLVLELALPYLPQNREEGERKAKTRPRLQAPSSSHALVPIGIRSCEEMEVLNPILQLILFLPHVRNLFMFAPHTFQPVSAFIEQYLADQSEGLTVTQADPRALLRCLRETLPAHYFRYSHRIEIHDFIFRLSKAAFPQIEMLIRYSDSIALHPEWHFYWDASIPFSVAVDRAWLREGVLSVWPAEFFVSPRGVVADQSCRLIQRQYFAKRDHTCYDLNAFIEHRPDERTKNHFIAYVKIGGLWYLCDHERVAPLRPTEISIPLMRSVLLYYRKVPFFARGHSYQ